MDNPVYLPAPIANWFRHLFFFFLGALIISSLSANLPPSYLEGEFLLADFHL